MMIIELLEIFLLTLISIMFAFALGLAFGLIIWGPFKFRQKADRPPNRQVEAGTDGTSSPSTTTDE